MLFEEKGYNKNIVILTQPRGYKKHANKLQPIISATMRKYPGLVNVLKKRHENYNESVRYVMQAEKEGRVLVICPPETLPVKRITHDRKKLEKTYEIGRKTAMDMLDNIKKFME